MKTFKCLVTTVLAFTLFSCQDNTDGPDNNKHEKVYLNVAISVPATKADLEAVENGYTSEIGDNSYVFVLDGANSIIGSPVKFTRNGDLNEMTFETTSEARSILFIANVSDDFNSSKYATRNSLEQEIFRMADLAPVITAEAENLHGIKNVMMYNTELPQINQDTPEEWSVAVTIAPIVSRIEILGISGDAPLSEQEIEAGYVGIESYELTGIFMNCIDEAMRLNGDVTGLNQLTGDITRTASDWSCDLFTDVVAAVNFSPANGAWAYHLAPSIEDVPQIVLVLENIKFTDGATANKLFITVKGYEDNNNSPIYGFKAGNVYQIENICFNHTHLSTEVNPEQIKLTATVSVKGWVVNPLLPVI